MPIETPKNWWKPLHKEEKIWVYVIIVWGVIMATMMPLGHMWGQNVSQTTYRTTTDQYAKAANKFIDMYKVGEEQVGTWTIPVVDASKVPKSSDGNVHLFLMARVFQFEPILQLQKGKEYKIHLSSMDYQHGFSLQPLNLNYQVLPGYDFVITMKPTTTGEYPIICNEYCGPGHHTMIGKIKVKE